MLSHHYRCVLDAVLPFELNDIKEQEVLHSGQFDNLMFDNYKMRVWLSRMTIGDGAPCNDEITVELLENGRWVTKHSFPLADEDG